jgi:hypothetical protein
VMEDAGKSVQARFDAEESARSPDVVRSDVSERCGFRPRDGEAQQTYFLSDGESTSALCAELVHAVQSAAVGATGTGLCAKGSPERDVLEREVSERCGFRPRDGEAQQTYFLSDGESTSALCLAGTENDHLDFAELVHAVQSAAVGATGTGLCAKGSPERASDHETAKHNRPTSSRTGNRPRRCASPERPRSP